MFNQDNITIAQRVAAPKPPLFKRILKIAAAIVPIAGAIAAAPVAPVVATIAGIIAAVGTGLAGAAALPVDFTKLNQQQADQ